LPSYWKKLESRVGVMSIRCVYIVNRQSNKLRKFITTVKNNKSIGLFVEIK